MHWSVKRSSISVARLTSFWARCCSKWACLQDSANSVAKRALSFLSAVISLCLVTRPCCSGAAPLSDAIAIRASVDPYPASPAWIAGNRSELREHGYC